MPPRLAVRHVPGADQIFDPGYVMHVEASGTGKGKVQSVGLAKNLFIPVYVKLAGLVSSALSVESNVLPSKTGPSEGEMCVPFVSDGFVFG